MAKFDDERIRAIVLGPRAFRTIPFPGQPSIKVAVRCLTEVEIDGCRVEAQRQLRELCKRRGWEPGEFTDIDPELFRRLLERQFIWRAFYDPETIERPEPEQFFSDDRQVESLDSTTTTRLAEAYLEHQDWTNPLLTLSAEEIDQLVDALSKAQAPELFLAALELSTLRRLFISLVSAVRTEISQTGKFSIGSSPEPTA